MRLRQGITDIREIGHDILSSTQSPTTGALLVNVGNSVSGQAIGEGCPVWNATAGVFCMPANPTKGQNSCQTLELTESDTNIVIACRDLRSVQSVGAMSPGDSCLYETEAGKARIYARATGEIDILANNGAYSIKISPSGEIKIDGSTIEVGPNATSVAIAGGQGSLVFASAYSAMITDVLSVLAGALSAFSSGGTTPVTSAELGTVGENMATTISMLPASFATTKTTAT